jgi:hypothetical protein
MNLEGTNLMSKASVLPTDGWQLPEESDAIGLTLQTVVAELRAIISDITVMSRGSTLDTVMLRNGDSAPAKTSEGANEWLRPS